MKWFKKATEMYEELGTLKGELKNDNADLQRLQLQIAEKKTRMQALQDRIKACEWGSPPTAQPN